MTTPSPSQKMHPLMQKALESLEQEVKRLRAARTKLSQTIKAMETLLEMLRAGTTSPTPEEAATSDSQQRLAKKHERPAAQVFRDVFHRYPRTPQMEVLVESVGESPEELSIWRETCTYWMLKGWNPDNVGGLMEIYNEKWLAQAPGSGHTLQVIDGLMYKVYADGDREPGQGPDGPS